MSFLQALRRRQAQKWCPLRLEGEYLELRESLVMLLGHLGEHFRLGADSVALGVGLMDRLLSGCPGLLDEDVLYASACLLVAAKRLERTGRVPSLPRLRRRSSPEHSLQQFQAAERRVLAFFKFELNCPTHL
jgi:hypothetical protein